MTNRCAIFIDNGYLSKIVPNGLKINFELFSDKVSDGNERLRTYFYDCMPYQSNHPTVEEKERYSNYCKFRDIIEGLPRFQMRFGKLQRTDDGSFRQKRVDILMAVELVRLSWSHQISFAVIIAGDSDFVPAIEAAKDAGVITKLVYSKKSIHDELLTSVDERFEMNKDFFDSVKR